jgi:hypothetical protein
MKIMIMPRPAPIYRNPAISVEGINRRSSFENGEFKAYNPAASIARNMPCLMSGFTRVTPE